MRPTDQQLLDALHSQSGGVEWIEADTVARHFREGQEGPTAVGVGLRLSRLARADRCHSKVDGYMSRYRSMYRG